MQRRIALKRLTASDLTLFRWHFFNKPAGNQKSINLNADVFIGQMFPSLPEVAEKMNWRIPLDLSIYGPGLAGLYNLQRKIVKGGAYKNWRLNGEFIANPTDDPSRFHDLQPGDFAIFDFFGSVIPNSAKMLLIAQTIHADKLLHQRASLLLAGKKMIVVSPEQVEALADDIQIEEHPIHEFALGAELEDAALGGATGSRVLSRKPLSRKIGRDDLQRARDAAEQIGRIGEEFVCAHLKSLQAQGLLKEVVWVSEMNAVAPYDFLIMLPDDDEVAIDVKTTAGEFERPIHISAGEIDEMSTGNRRYDLYRVFEVDENTAKLRVIEGVRDFAAAVRQELSGLTKGVEADSVSVLPAVLQFGPTKMIEMPDEEEVEVES